MVHELLRILLSTKIVMIDIVEKERAVVKLGNELAHVPPVVRRGRIPGSFDAAKKPIGEVKAPSL